MTSRIFVVAFISIACVISANAQGKGVDRQSERIRDAGSVGSPGKNGSKQDVGTGRGIDFGRGRTPAAVVIPNPLRVTARRDVLIQTLEELMRERKLILDTVVSKLGDGILVSQPYTFSKGSIVTDSELSRYAVIPAESDRNWTRGRYTMIIEVQPIDGNSANVSANARIEAKGESVTGSHWDTLQSSGIVEQEFLSALLTKLNDSPLPQTEGKQ